MPGKRYRLKLATTRVGVHVKEIVQVLDAATLERSESDAHKGHVGRHEVAECVLETQNPIAFDLGLGAEFAATGRFVLVDEYEIAGGGIVTEYVSGLKASLREHVKQRDYAWVRGAITPAQRSERYRQRPRLVVLTGEDGDALHELARDLEDRLFRAGGSAYYLGLTNLARGLDATMDEAAARAAAHADEDRGEHLRRLGEVAHILGDAGQIVITTVTGLDAAEAEILRILNEPNDMLVIRVGADHHAVNADLVLVPGTPPERAVAEAYRLLREREVVLEYYL